MDLCKRRWKKIFFTAVIACLGLSLIVVQRLEAKADRYFVDYENNTGYYVDVNSIEIPSDHEVELDLYLVKLHGGFMYRYRAYFDTLEGSYQYRQARVYNYETKKLMTGTAFVQDKLSYHRSPMLEQVVDFAIDWKKSHIHKTPYGETWED